MNKLNNNKSNNNKFSNLTNFIKTQSKKTILKKLYNVIQDATFCPKVLGQGFSGQVYLPIVNTTFPYKIGAKTIQLPIAIKVENADTNNNKYWSRIDILDNKLYISGYGGLTTEALVLMFIDKIRYKTVHLPLLLAYATCQNTKSISHLYTLKYGLDTPIKIDLTGKLYNEATLWHPHESDMGEMFISPLATLGDLFTYFHYTKNKNDIVTLPNKIKCSISELYDYLCISFFATHMLLVENNIYQSDMHSANIFIHWLNDNSFYGDKNIKNLEYITYKIGSKYYKIKTFGFIMILGDTGTFNIKIKKDVILIGQAPYIERDYYKYNRRMTDTHHNMDFIIHTHDFLTPRQFNNTVARYIINDEPYCNYPKKTFTSLGTDMAYLDKLKPTYELLKFYDNKYGVRKYENTKDNILIEL